MEYLDKQLPYEWRQAAIEELDRMKCHVLWVYQQGRPVVLWKRSGFISLVPDSLPLSEVIILINSRIGK